MGKNSDFECDMLDGTRESAQPGGEGGSSRGEYALARPRGHMENSQADDMKGNDNSNIRL